MNKLDGYCVRRIVHVAIMFASTILFYSPVGGQTPTPSPIPAGTSSPTSAASKPQSDADKFKRWFEFDTLSLATRYHYIRNTNGHLVTDNGQYQVQAKGHFKFDSKGRYSVYAGVYTGNPFNSGWNNTGLGAPRYSTNLFLKQLYFEAKPVKTFEFQVGGITPYNGENTEVTGYDTDGFMMGERVYIRAPKHAYFDEISITNGFIGDLNKPSVFHRFKHLNKSNYHQFLVRKQVNKMVAFSADYTFDSGVDILRQGLKVTLPKGKVLDIFQFENYERLDPSPGYGFQVYGQKKLHKYLTLGGGFARIDRTMLNSDRFPRGDRFYLTSVTNFSKEFSLTATYIHGVAELLPTVARTRVNIIFTYNLLETLRRKKIL